MSEGEIRVVGVTAEGLGGAHATHFWRTPVGREALWTVRTRTGRQVTTSARHPFLTPEGWKRADELATGDRIAIARRILIEGRSQPLPGIARLGHDEVDVDRLPLRPGRKFDIETQRRIIRGYLGGHTITGSPGTSARTGSRCEASSIAMASGPGGGGSGRRRRSARRPSSGAGSVLHRRGLRLGRRAARTASRSATPIQASGPTTSPCPVPSSRSSHALAERDLLRRAEPAALLRVARLHVPHELGDEERAGHPLPVPRPRDRGLRPGLPRRGRHGGKDGVHAVTKSPRLGITAPDAAVAAGRRQLRRDDPLPGHERPDGGGAGVRADLGLRGRRRPRWPSGSSFRCAHKQRNLDALVDRRRRGSGPATGTSSRCRRRSSA